MVMQAERRRAEGSGWGAEDGRRARERREARSGGREDGGAVGGGRAWTPRWFQSDLANDTLGIEY